MQPLRQVIAALRQEIAAALDEASDLPSRARLEPERVVLTLALSVQEMPASDGSVGLDFCVPHSTAEASSGPEGQAARSPTHTLTIDFRLASASEPAVKAMAQPNRETTQKPAQPESPTAEQVSESLVSIFGAPSFDSSARASVFREALAGLSDDQARAVVDSLRGMPTPGITPAAARASRLINRLVEGAPAGPTRSREVLADVVYRYSVQSLIRLVREKWKTQEEWLDEPVQRPSSAGMSQRNQSIR